MADVEQLDLFVYLQAIENQVEVTPTPSIPAPSIPAPSIPTPVTISIIEVWSRFLRRLGAVLSSFWIIAHNLFGIACWVNVYTVTRSFGGMESGGWYYLKYECVKSRQVGFWDAEALSVHWMQQFTLSHRWGDLKSKAGGQDVAVRIESRRAASRTAMPPHYQEYADHAIPYGIVQGSH